MHTVLGKEEEGGREGGGGEHARTEHHQTGATLALNTTLMSHQEGEGQFTS